MTSVPFAAATEKPQASSPEALRRPSEPPAPAEAQAEPEPPREVRSEPEIEQPVEDGLERDAPTLTLVAEPALEDEELPPSNFANQAMTRLWRNAQDRETGTEAIEAIRARRRQERTAPGGKRKGRWHFGRGD